MAATDLGTRIRELRHARGLSVKKLGELCNVSDSEVSRIENGERTSPNCFTLCRMARVLRQSPLDFLVLYGAITEEEIEAYESISIR